MPILVKDFMWTQTPSSLNIRIPLNSTNRNKPDVFTTDSYIKIHYNPFLFEVFLLYDVDSSKGTCTVQDDLIVLDLVKKKELDWVSLEKSLSKEEKMEARQKIHERCQEEAKVRSEQKSLKKNQLDRYAVQQAMEIDSKQHSLMDSRRNHERDKAMNQLEQWREKFDRKFDAVPSVEVNGDKNFCSQYKKAKPINDNSGGVKIIELSSSGDEENDIDNETKKNVSQKPKISKQPLQCHTENKKEVKSEYVEKKKKEAATRVLPKLRETRELEIKHTPRSFPTPSRESTVDEEEAWLKNITQARRAIGFVSEDLRPEEQDPQWCKEKGDEFFRNGNFLGAISAYTHGITLSDKLPSLFSNRAATHFALGNFNKCVNDCSTALDLLKPPCEGNRRSRAKCIARRAAALARLGYLSKAIDEMKAASNLLPDDENIKNDVHNMERAWEQNPDSE
ncbi:unnamed protein product, partial [Iphiclides podalirius]